MSIVIKSNVAATASIGNIHLYNGPMDFASMLNFERGMYSASGVGLELVDVLEFSRSSQAEYSDASGNRRVAAINEPRIHRLGSGRAGLMLESSSTNLFPGSPTPGTHTVSVPLVGGAENYVSLMVWGSGSVAISTTEPTTRETPNLVATEDDPAVMEFSRGLRTISVTLTVSGSVNRINLANTPSSNWGSVLPTPVPAGQAARSSDVASIAAPAISGISASVGTIVAAYSRNTPIFEQGDGTGVWFSIRSTGNNLAGVHIRSVSRTSLVAVAYNTGGAQIFNEVMPMPDADSRTIGLAWAGTTMRFAVNGLVHEFTIPTLPTFSGLAISGSTAGIAYSGHVNSALTHLATYSRALSPIEMQNATLSWV